MTVSSSDAKTLLEIHAAWTEEEGEDPEEQGDAEDSSRPSLLGRASLAPVLGDPRAHPRRPARARNAQTS